MPSQNLLAALPLLVILVILAGCGGADPTPEEGASGPAVEASVNTAEAILNRAEEQAENRADGLKAVEARGEAMVRSTMDRADRPIATPQICRPSRRSTEPGLTRAGAWLSSAGPGFRAACPS